MSITKINYEGAEVPIIERRTTDYIQKQFDLSVERRIKPGETSYDPFGLKEKEAIKNDSGKPDWTLVPFQSLEGMVQVLEFGAKKYAAYNWTKGGGFSWVRVTASCFRHLFAWLAGQDNDPESGLNHIYHAQCNLLFLAHYIRNKELYNKDDRVKNV